MYPYGTYSLRTCKLVICTFPLQCTSESSTATCVTISPTRRVINFSVKVVNPVCKSEYVSRNVLLPLMRRILQHPPPRNKLVLKRLRMWKLLWTFLRTKKHGSKYSVEQLNAWAHMMGSMYQPKSHLHCHTLAKE